MSKLLIVEDEESIRECLREVFEMEKVEVVTAENGLVALNHLKETKILPQLILLDLNMPVMSGKELLAHIKIENGPFSKIPVLVMTAVPDASLMGVIEILRKPIGIEEILKKVMRFM